MKTLPEIRKALENELAKPQTDMQTWESVEEFWRVDYDIHPQMLQTLLDRVELLESKMYSQHGWKREAPHWD